MQYYILVNIVLGLFFISFLWLIYVWIKKDSSSIQLAYLAGFSILITFIFKFPFSNHFFGLEYEDAYIFNFSARQLSENIYPISLSTDGISIGSLNNPISTVTYGGHFITYPTFISWFFNIFGYKIYLPSYINAFIGFVSVFTLSILFKNILKFDKTWWVGGLVYSVAPIINIFSNTHLSETFSSFTVLLSIVSFYYYYKSKQPLSLVVFSIFFLTALLTKRENLVLLSFYLVFSMYAFFTYKKRWKANLAPLFISLIIIAIYLAFIKNVFLIEQTEASEISTSTFSFYNFFNLVPIFTKALFNIKWFSIHSILLILAFLHIIFSRRNNIFLISLIVLYISFFVIYTFHYRSYYFIHFGKVEPFESIRYLNNFFIISSIVISIVICDLSKNKLFLKIQIPILFVLLILSFIFTNTGRKNFSSLESEERFNNPRRVLQLLSKNNDNSVLITDNILIFQLLGKNDLNLIDLKCFNDYKLNKHAKYIFLTNHNKQESFKCRHPIISKKISSMNLVEVLKFKNNDGLYRIE